MPSDSLSSSSVALRSSASTYIVRNFHTRNVRPSWPTRGCRKKTGPGSESRMPIAITARTGLSTSRPRTAATRSSRFFASQPGPERVGSSTCSSGRPSIGRMCTRGPAMSVSCGATTRSTPVPSSCQASRRSSPGSALAEPQTAIVSRADLADQGQHVAAGVDRDRGLDAAGGRVAVGEVDGDRDQAGGRAAGDRGVDLERLGQRAHQDHPVRAVAGAACGPGAAPAGRVRGRAG